MRLIVLICICFIFQLHAAKVENIDSLKQLLSETNDLAEWSIIERRIGISYYYKSNLDSAELYANRCLKHALETAVDTAKIKAYLFRANIHWFRKEKSMAVSYFETAAKIAKNANEENTLADIYQNLAFIYSKLNKDDKSTEYRYRALYLYEKLNELKPLMRIHQLLAETYVEAENYERSLHHYQKAIQYSREKGSISKEKESYHYEAAIYSKLGLISLKQDSLDKALKYCKKSIEIQKSKRKKEDKTIFSNRNVIARIYFEQNLINQAKTEYQDALASAKALKKEKESKLKESGISKKLKSALKRDINDINKEIVLNHIGYSDILIKEKSYAKTISLLNSIKSYEIIKNEYQIKSRLYSNLKKAYTASGNTSKALQSLEELYIADSIISELNNSKQIMNAQMIYNVEKTEDKINSEKQEVIDEINRQKQRQEYFTIAGAVFGLLVLIIACIITLNFLKERKTKEHIQGLNSELTNKNKNILDSINYAEKIQKAILPPAGLLKDLLGEYFLYFKPKDIVSGDFYWIRKWKDSVILCVADCTGHGVPGAFMSMLGFENLNQAIHDLEDKVSAAGMLNQLNDNIKLALSAYSEQEAIKDGMDLSLIQYFPKEKRLSFAGAGNPCYIIRESELIEYKGDIFPIGHYHESTDKLKFKQHEIQLQKNDCVYLFTDGYPDQFGGGKGKKLKYRAFKALLKQNHKVNLDTQLTNLSNYMDDWRGNEEQIDDMCVIGFRV